MTLTQTSIGPVAWHSQGTGRPLLLLSANPGDRRDWDAVIPDLARDHRVIAVDWPGHGDSPAPEPPRPMTAMMYATVLAELAEALGLEGAIVLGNSVGGYAAVRLALEHPARVAALVLVDPAGSTRHGLVSLRVPRDQGPRVAAPPHRRPLRPPLPAPPHALDRRDDCARRRRAREPGAGRGRRRDLALVPRSADHLRARAGAVAQPTLLVWGRHDPVVRMAHEGREARAAMPSAQWVDLDTGHAPFAEDPDAFLAAVRPFLAEVAA